MVTAADYRALAEQCLKWAGEAVTRQERDAQIRSAEIWIQSALRSERLSKQPPAITEYEWVLPPFQEWRRTGTAHKDKARRITANIAKLPALLNK
jgi:hypothetical protein